MVNNLINDNNDINWALKILIRLIYVKTNNSNNLINDNNALN